MSAPPGPTTILRAYERVCAASLRQRAAAGLAPPPRVPVARLDAETRKQIGLDETFYKTCAAPFDFADACAPDQSDVHQVNQIADIASDVDVGIGNRTGIRTGDNGSDSGSDSDSDSDSGSGSDSDSGSGSDSGSDVAGGDASDADDANNADFVAGNDGVAGTGVADGDDFDDIGLADSLASTEFSEKNTTPAYLTDVDENDLAGVMVRK
jgi:hypothetical protein